MGVRVAGFTVPFAGKGRVQRHAGTIVIVRFNRRVMQGAHALN